MAAPEYGNPARAVALVDSTGTAYDSKPVSSGTGTQANVASSAADGTILAANTARKGATVFNDSTAILYLLLGAGTSSATVNSVQVAPGGYYEAPFGYTGIIKGLWASANGSARVTEFT